MTDPECLAILVGTRKFRQCIAGVREVVVHSDDRSLVYTVTTPHLGPRRLLRWAFKLSTAGLGVLHIAAKHSQVAESRVFPQSPQEHGEEAVAPVAPSARRVLQRAFKGSCETDNLTCD